MRMFTLVRVSTLKKYYISLQHYAAPNSGKRNKLFDQELKVLLEYNNQFNKKL